MSSLHRKILARLAKLKLGTTMCPGQLSRDCGTTLAEARADLMALAESGKVTLSQKGKLIAPRNIRGPFRIRLEH